MIKNKWMLKTICDQYLGIDDLGIDDIFSHDWNFYNNNHDFYIKTRIYKCNRCKTNLYILIFKNEINGIYYKELSFNIVKIKTCNQELMEKACK